MDWRATAVLFAAGTGGRWVLVAQLRQFNASTVSAETKKNQQSNIEIYA
jgi:hypothetical protein